MPEKRLWRNVCEMTSAVRGCEEDDGRPPPTGCTLGRFRSERTGVGGARTRPCGGLLMRTYITAVLLSVAGLTEAGGAIAQTPPPPPPPPPAAPASPPPAPPPAAPPAAAPPAPPPA